MTLLNPHKNQSIVIVIAGIMFFFCLPANACLRKRFDIASYGEDTKAITRLVSDINKNKGGHIIFPRNKTLVLTIGNDSNSGHKLLPQENAVLFAFKDCKDIEIDLNGSTIILDKNHSSKYALFYFFNCRKFSLKNGSIVGDAKVHDYSPVSFKGKMENSSHEWGHGVMVIGSQGVISDLNISYMTGDGIYVASRKISEVVIGSKIDIVGCDISFCRRNGITSASTFGFRLTDSNIHEIGSYGGLSGTDPRAGIDFEYEDQVWCKGNVLITGCSFSNCEKKTITTSNVYIPKTISFIAENCVFSGSIVQIANLEADRGKTIKNSHFKEAPINCGRATLDNCHFLMGSKLYYAHGTTFHKCEFMGTTENLTGPYGCAIVGYSTDPASFDRCTFSNIRGLNNTSPAYQGISGYNFPLVASFNKCTFHNTSFVKGNPKHESSFDFDGCTLSDGCMIYNEGGKAIMFVDSKVDNVDSYPTQTGEFIFDNCEIIQDDESVINPLIFFGTHTLKKSHVKNTLTISQSMKTKGVRGIKYKIQ